MEIFAFAFSALIAHVLTNLDNLAIMVGLIFTVGRARTLVGYLIAQFLVLCAAWALAEGALSEMPHMVGYLGVVPLMLGLVALWRNWRGESEVDQHSLGNMRFLAVTALFVSVSFDSFAVLAPLTADSEFTFRWAALSGAAVASILISCAGLVLSSLTPMAVDRVVSLERFAPYAMISVGVYILLNTATDIL